MLLVYYTKNEVKHSMNDTGFWHCENCDSYWTTDELDSKEVDMEDYYGVGGDFPDHHFQDFYACPDCGSIDDLESISEEDYDEAVGEEDDDGNEKEDD